MVPSGRCTYLITPTYRADRGVRDTSKFVTRPRVRCSYRPGHYSFPRCPRIRAEHFVVLCAVWTRVPHPLPPPRYTFTLPSSCYERFILILRLPPTIIFSRHIGPRPGARNREKVTKHARRVATLFFTKRLSPWL